MLVELQIRDFAIIDRLTVPFRPGLNIVTGETGAGKSIVIDAIGAVLGARTASEVVRSGRTTARIEAVFDLEAIDLTARRRLDATLEDFGLIAEDGLLVLTREIQAGGRTNARVGGRLVPVGALQRIGDLLVDVHGQHEHVSLLRARDQLDLMDRYAGNGTIRGEVFSRVSRLRKMHSELATLAADERALARQVDLLRFQVDEIAGAGLQPGEEEALAAEQRLIASAERLAALAGEAYRALNGPGGARDRLSETAASLRQIAAIDPDSEEKCRLATELVEQADDLTRSLRTYREAIDFSPQRLAEIESRMALISGLCRKYGDTIEDILAFGARASNELDGLVASAYQRERLLSDEMAERSRLSLILGELAARRAVAASRISREVEVELADLGFGRAQFSVDQRRSPTNDGIAVDGFGTVAFDETGIDRIEFLLAATPGDPPKPLSRVASGGETSRIMLALKSVLGRVDQVPTLIFDEVDTGIGGRTGRIVGEKLWRLARDHQVICVTHLPQVAGFADHHLSVTKEAANDRTEVTVRTLESDERKVELAHMFGSATSANLGSADDLLSRVDVWKSGQVAPSTATLSGSGS